MMIQTDTLMTDLVVQALPQSLQEGHIIRHIQLPPVPGTLGLLEEATPSSPTSRPNTSPMFPKTIRDTLPRQLLALHQRPVTQHPHQDLQLLDLLLDLPTKAATFRQSM